MSAPTDTYRFGPFEARTCTREIYKYGLKLKLRPQPFHVLQVLLESSGELVTRDRLRQTLWSAETYVDFEHGLNTSMKELRRVLGDSARQPRYIETLPKLGYRMLVPVEAQPVAVIRRVPVSGTDGAEPRDKAIAVSEAGVRHRPWLWWCRAVLYGGCAAALLVGGWVVFNRQAAPESSMPVPLTSFPGMERAATWSPDGQQVAFAWTGEQRDGFHIYVMRPGSSQTLRLTTESGEDDVPAWSPDGRWIAYVHIAPDRTRSLKLVSPLGGPPRVISIPWKRFGALSWARDSRSLVIEVVTDPTQPSALWAVSVEADDRFELTWPPAGIPGDTDPAVSPDGKVVAFCRATAWRTRELYVVDLQPDRLSRRAPRRLTDLGYLERPAWTPDGRRILFGAFREGAGIWQIDRNGGRPRPVLGVPETASLPALSLRPAGLTSLVFTNSASGTSIWRYDTTERESGAPPVELAASSRSQGYPSYSPDGKRLAFTSTRTGHQEIWVANADGSKPMQVTDLRHRLTEEADWSPAGDQLAFVSQDRGERQIYLVNSTGGAATAITNEQGIRFGGGWSRDGTGYYYTSTRSGRSEVWRVPRAGGTAQQMTATGGQYGFESPEGVFYYWRLEGGSSGQHAALMRRLQTGEQEVALIPKGLACKTARSPRGFYFKAADTGDIYLYDEASGRSRCVLRHPPSAYSFTMSPDGRWFAIELPRRVGQDLMIMERFR